MKKVIGFSSLVVGGLIGLSLVYGFDGTNLTQQQKDRKGKIQIAILFDTSNSMDGLIDQARSRIWNIVNTMSSLTQNRQMPDIEIALYEYGNDFLAEKDGFVRQVLPLSTDLDLLSEQLFLLKTNGGDEYCGTVISQALEQLKWSTSPQDMRIIYIAGNEPFDQGQIDYKKVGALAVQKDIKIHTIYCGDRERGIQELWYNGAKVGKGEYSNINSDLEAVQYETPFDVQINAYNDSLNGTYVTYGKERERFKANQLKQDERAFSVSQSVQADRTIAKTKSNYMNASWDLVDAVKHEEGFKIEELKKNELPLELQGKSNEEIQKHVELKSKERQRFQDKISDLSKNRALYIAELKLKEAPQAADLGEEINKGILKLAEEKGFNVEK